MSHLPKRNARSSVQLITTVLLIFMFPSLMLYWAYAETSGLRRVLEGAVETQGVVEKIVAVEGFNRRTKQDVVTGHRVYVKFRAPSGAELVKPLQHEVDEPFTTVIGIETATRYFTVNETIPILYNPGLGDRVWVDDFFELWVFPIFLVLMALACIVIAGLVLFASSKKRPEKR